MKKLLGLTIAALLVMGLVGGGTWAYFSDVETSAGNSLSAGTLDLTLAFAPTKTTTFLASNVNPGKTGNGYSTIKNIGTLPGKLTIDTINLLNTESTGDTQYEKDLIGEGELGAVAKMAIWIDMVANPENGTYEAGTDIGLTPTGTYITGALQYFTINSFGGKTWADILTDMPQNDIHRFNVNWDVPYGGSVDNTYQGDSVSIDFKFTLLQKDNS